MQSPNTVRLAAACPGGWWLPVHRQPDPAMTMSSPMKHEMAMRKTVAALTRYLDRIFR